MRGASGAFAATAMRVLSRQEDFWKESAAEDVHKLLCYSFYLGFFAFAGYLFSYTVRGTIWNFWPFIQTTLDVGSGLVFAGLQWVFFCSFPVWSALILERITSRSKMRFEFYNCVVVTTYSMTPLCLCVLFIGVPFVDRILSTIGFTSFLYLLYYGFRSLSGFTISRAFLSTLLVLILFALIREMFVFAIGF